MMKMTPEYYCSNCKEAFKKDDKHCRRCGNARPEIKKVDDPITFKNPGVSAVLSALIPGLGQIYNGQIGKGIFFIILSAMLIQAYLTGINAFGVIVSLGLWIYAIYNAYNFAILQNQKIKP